MSAWTLVAVIAVTVFILRSFLSVLLRQIPVRYYVVAAGIAGVGIVGYLAVGHLFGRASVTVFAGRTPTTVTVYEGETALQTVELAPSEHKTVALRRGEYQVVATWGQGHHEQKVRVKSGLERLGVVTDADGCFVFLDYTNQYRRGGRVRDVPRVKRVKRGEVAELGDNVYLAHEALPSSRKRNESVYLLRRVSCERLSAATDDEVARFALAEPILSDPRRLQHLLDEQRSRDEDLNRLLGKLLETAVVQKRPAWRLSHQSPTWYGWNVGEGRWLAVHPFTLRNRFAGRMPSFSETARVLPALTSELVGKAEGSEVEVDGVFGHNDLVPVMAHAVLGLLPSEREAAVVLESDGQRYLFQLGVASGLYLTRAMATDLGVTDAALLALLAKTPLRVER